MSVWRICSCILGLKGLTCTFFETDFELETDHKPLEYIYSQKSKPSTRVERWVLHLQAYDFKIIYRPGRTNVVKAES